LTKNAPIPIAANLVANNIWRQLLQKLVYQYWLTFVAQS